MERKINERLQELRKTLNLNQTEFASRLGLTSSSISRLEAGKTILTDQNINLISLTFNINEDWLRNGVGEMFSRNVSSGELKRLTDYFCQLQPETRKMILAYAEMLLKNEQALKDEIVSDIEEVLPVGTGLQANAS
jgi:transcriptional regulator with XRE-family HTH domain